MEEAPAEGPWVGEDPGGAVEEGALVGEGGHVAYPPSEVGGAVLETALLVGVAVLAVVVGAHREVWP